MVIIILKDVHFLKGPMFNAHFWGVKVNVHFRKRLYLSKWTRIYTQGQVLTLTAGKFTWKTAGMFQWLVRFVALISLKLIPCEQNKNMLFIYAFFRLVHPDKCKMYTYSIVVTRQFYHQIVYSKNKFSVDPKSNNPHTHLLNTFEQKVTFSFHT